MIYNTLLDYIPILKAFENSLKLPNLIKNKKLLFAISPKLTIKTLDYMSNVKDFPFTAKELIDSLYYSKEYYFNYPKGEISYRYPAQRKIIVFRKVKSEDFIKSIFLNFSIEKIEHKPNLELSYVYFTDEKTAKEAFQYYEKYQYENGHENFKFPSAYMECENLKYKILGITPEIEADICEVPIFSGNGGKRLEVVDISPNKFDIGENSDNVNSDNNSSTDNSSSNNNNNNNDYYYGKKCYCYRRRFDRNKRFYYNKFNLLINKKVYNK